MKIWIKTISGDKITRSRLFELTVNRENFISVLQETCHELDVPTPIVTSVNVQHFLSFNVTKFRAKDFIEWVDFDYLEMEAVPDKRKN